MARPLVAASAAWTVATLAAIAGVLLPSNYMRVSLALFASAVGLALLVAGVLVTDGLRHRQARRRDAVRTQPSPLGRLEYLPSVTTGTRRIRWRGADYRVTRGRSGAAPAAAEPRGAQHAPDSSSDLMGSASPRPASSTTQPRNDEVPAHPRAS